MTETSRVLSIQSHVVFGYVGNKAATLPLQLHGIEVDPLNTVQFSNHKGYAICTGSAVTADQMRVLVDGMRGNKFTNNYSAVLSGFMASHAILSAVVDTVQTIRADTKSATGRDVLWLCDPVLGDNGKLYVPQELLPIYREQVFPHASVITPNHFEAEQLTGQPIRSLADAKQACDVMHTFGPRIVVITSMEAPVASAQDKLVLVASDASAKERIVLEFSKIPADFCGCGDLFASLLLAMLLEHPEDTAIALHRAVSGMHCVLSRTRELGREELAIVQSQKDIILCDVRKFDITVVREPFA
jgi:pyridoxine kinase